jgi:hypothetical protein
MKLAAFLPGTGRGLWAVWSGLGVLLSGFCESDMASGEVIRSQTTVKTNLLLIVMKAIKVKCFLYGEMANDMKLPATQY